MLLAEHAMIASAAHFLGLCIHSLLTADSKRNMDEADVRLRRVGIEAVGTDVPPDLVRG